jgi:hypothetical protein
MVIRIIQIQQNHPINPEKTENIRENNHISELKCMAKMKKVNPVLFL